LGHGLFFALGGYVMGMYLMRQIGRDGNYKSDLPDFMVFLDWKELPWFWQGSEHFIWALLVIVLVPGLLALSVCQRFSQRLTGVWLVMLLAVTANGLSATLTYGPEHAWHWWVPQVWAGMGCGALLCLAMIKWRENNLLIVLCGAQLLLLLLLNLLPASTYFEQTMQTWEQGRFIRFHGLTPWLSWCWPWLLLAWASWRMMRRSAVLHRA
jgi:ABC-type branched-subunit amino acid transport system permease subunit